MELIVVKNAALPLLLSIGGINLFFFFIENLLKKKFRQIYQNNFYYFLGWSQRWLWLTLLITNGSTVSKNRVKLFWEQGNYLFFRNSGHQINSTVLIEKRLKICHIVFIKNSNRLFFISCYTLFFLNECLGPEHSFGRWGDEINPKMQEILKIHISSTILSIYF